MSASVDIEPKHDCIYAEQHPDVQEWMEVFVRTEQHGRHSWWESDYLLKLEALGMPSKSVDEVKAAASGTTFCRVNDQYLNLLTPREICCLTVAHFQVHEKHRADLDNGEVFCLID